MDAYLLAITVAAIVIVIVGVSVFKWHAFISLTVASLFLAIASGLSMDKIVGAYETGVGGVLGHLVGILALGTILGKLMADSGAGMQVADYFVRIFGVKRLPWAMLVAGFIIGIPVFFEVGILILLPLVISIHKTTKQNILLIALPVIAGLSIVHGLVPPHPGAMAAISIYGANTGKVLLYALIISIPAAVIAGPVFAKWVHKRVVPEGEPDLIRITTTSKDLPGTGVSFFVILLPVLLMVLAAIAPVINGLPNGVVKFVELIGSPLIALLIACFAAFYLLGKRQGMTKDVIKKLTEECLLPVGSIVLIIGAGGGFKQVLIDSGVGTTIGQMSEHLSLSPLVLAFLIAGLIRIATGSATVALTTAAGIVSPIIEHMSGVNLELLVIVTGAGSLMFSHVNDAGFWMVKEYLGLTVKETFKTWTVLETLLSFIAFAGALILNALI
ncbi:2-keto-3-deoxygluconate permease [Priestia megaterium]|jgi:gluconate:H+ symporter, GntP family|uniref:Transporter, gluconate:H+ symporter family protein n=1 Tax=Priestia megaterium (strain ATCC 14581 / DSM 32 / CCUG 1817 / JCM 2506 / NBRC 15308 / NCIMB 9376 / NCTC 10342 / NRRL B-14308 / VKM B-512 / Ford 19) TaxID=1348623 RepID=A0A0B6AIP2_PRIM2|nr:MULTISPECIES: gluconate:H+ symporter [Priestia]AJI20433.1 transporter, gluconate:H+ symporter family protein [Priestia megaterium NBRC 15308 = ATCC 14581]KFM96798.1 transporter, gluconate:H+ symporter family protein [Priestia megaterium]KGJ76326.1 2-keto-3-deoxygluconate permease [Priestia megaterium NBRC 15308 = ATCC 14581]MBU8751974.1 GntP family permease [Priestia megaterium]MCU7711146.1 GntP family permease [Priestia megaterium]